jgi:hypothetical protein
MFAMLLGAASFPVCADQIVMQNGDRYAGKVLYVNTDNLVLQSEVLGRVQLPRSKVSAITFGSAITNGLSPSPFQTNSVRPLASVSTTNADADLSASLRQLGTQTNLIQQVQRQFLAGAGPEANDTFNQLLGGLMSGKVSLGDLRAQAQSAADQLRALKGDLGEDAGVAVDGYLAILDQFLREVPASGATATNFPSLAPSQKARGIEEEK